MPMYDLRCFECGATDVIFRKMANRDLDLPHCPTCQKAFTRVISPTRIHSEIEPYESPKSGRWITSRTQMREDLAATGSIISEPGLRKDIERNRLHEKEKAFAPVEKAVDQHVAAMVAAGKLET